MPAAATTPSSEEPSAPPAGGADEGAWARFAAAPWVASTYFAEGLPFSIVRQISSQYFTAMGASLPAVGLTSLYNFAWNFKLLWSPLVDRYGTVRRWLLVTELLLGLVVAAIAWPAGLADLPAVARALVVVAFLAATHDIAIDGFYLGALDKRAQTQLSGLRVSAYRAALLVGNGLLVILAGIASWRVVFAVAGALLVALAGAHALWLPRPARPARPVPAETPGATAPDYLEAFASFFRQPDIGVSLAFILLFNAGDSLMFAMNAPFLKSLGFLERGRGALSTLGTVVFIVGSISSAAAIARYGLRRVLPRVAAVQSLAILLYVALAVTRPAMPWVAAAAVVEQLVVGVASPAFSVFLMRRCGAEHRAAHFAIATALMSVASTGAGAVSGYVAEPLGYPTFFAIAFMASLPGVALSWLVPRE